MVVVLTGGGSGGHITPVLAVARALKQKHPDIRIIYIGQKGDKLGDIVADNKDIDEVRFISGGKWRRYHGEGWRQIFDIFTLLKNIRDFFRVIIGTLQSIRLLGKLRPDGVFIKGAYVGVPVGWAARLHRIPYVTLDLDALPSLANRLIAKHAAAHAVGMPKELYNYPADKTFYVGVPINEKYQLVNRETQTKFKNEIGLGSYGQVVLAVGGGLGAQRLNDIVLASAPKILSKYPKLVIIHVVGRDHETTLQQQYSNLLETTQQPRVIVRGFIDDLYRYSGSADLIISRAGATSLAEFAMQGKACIVIPNPLLTGGHQLKNAQQLAAHGAIKVLNEDEPQVASGQLYALVDELLQSETACTQLGATLQSFAHPKAAAEVAELLLQTFKVVPHEIQTKQN